ncbi:hypothetical protein D9M72_571090 [compost metagenome]
MIHPGTMLPVTDCATTRAASGSTSTSNTPIPPNWTAMVWATFPGGFLNGLSPGSGTATVYRAEMTDARPRPVNRTPRESPSRAGSHSQSPVKKNGPTLKTSTMGNANARQARARPSLSWTPRTPLDKCRANAVLS